MEGAVEISYSQPGTLDELEDVLYRHYMDNDTMSWLPERTAPPKTQHTIHKHKKKKRKKQVSPDIQR